MKIAYFVGTFFPHPGGVQIQTHNIANSLVKMGNEVDVYLLNKTNLNNNLYRIFVINKIVVSFFFYLNFYLKINLSFFFKMYLRYFLNVEKYDLFHFHFLNSKMLYIIKNLKSFDKKIIASFHGEDIQTNKEINYGLRINSLHEKLLKQVIFKIDFFFSISKIIKKEILKFGIDKKKIFITPNTICLDKIKHFKNFNKSIKKKIHLLTVTRFSKKTKGLDLIPVIANILSKNNIIFEWSLVGKNIDKLKKFKDMKNSKKNFKFVKNILNFNEEFFPNNKLIKIYKNNHLYISLSRIESFGISVLEALACGLPVVSFNTSGVNEIIINNHNGKLVNEHSANAISEKIISYYFSDEFKIHKVNATKSVLKYDLNKISSYIFNKYKFISNLK